MAVVTAKSMAGLLYENKKDVTPKTLNKYSKINKFDSIIQMICLP